MLTITVGGEEVYDESADSFSVQGGTQLQLEHSLVSLSKWESEFEKPFLSKDSKSPQEIVGYVRCMLVGENPPEEFLQRLSEDNLKSINDYIDRKMSATFFPEAPGAPASRETVTAELIYYWMTVFQIDWEAQYWHLNRLFTLIRICNMKQDNKPKKMSRTDQAARRRELNARRRKELGTTG